MASGRPPEPNNDLQELGLLKMTHDLAVTTPGFIRMRGHPEFQGWAADLVGFAEREDLRSLAEALQCVASNGLVGDRDTSAWAPLMEALRKSGLKVEPRTLMRGSFIAEETTTETPYASFALAWVIMCIWILCAPARGEGLYGEQKPLPGFPHPGWRSIPAACIVTSINLGGLYGSAVLAREAFDVLQTSRRRHMDYGSFEPAITNYRRLAQSIATRYDLAVDNLADALREACRLGAGRARAIVAALLWSLGLVPESNAFRRIAGKPSRSLLRRLIKSSINCLPDDPLIQYIWLESKDDGFDLRAHEALFTVMNHRWNQWRLDDDYEAFGLTVGPSRLFARTLISLLAGDLEEPRAAAYLHAFDLVTRLTGPTVLMQRLLMLRHLIADRFKYYAPEFTPSERIALLKKMTEEASRSREDAERHPYRADDLSRSSLPMFEFIESCLAEDVTLDLSERERCALVLETLEQFRTSALTYWLRVSPPLTLSSDIEGDVESGTLLRAERELLEDLRGAYYLALRPILPKYTQWSDLEYGNALQLQNPERRDWFYSADVATTEMEQVEYRLTKVYERLETRAPGYALRRLAPTADVEQLVTILNHHTNASRRA